MTKKCEVSASTWFYYKDISEVILPWAKERFNFFIRLIWSINPHKKSFFAISL